MNSKYGEKYHLPANTKEILSLALGTALVFALLPTDHRKAKIHMTFVWLIYSIVYNDFVIMSICLLLITLNFFE